MTSTPSHGRGGDAGSALSRLKNKGRLNKASSGSVVSEMIGSDSPRVSNPEPVASSDPVQQQTSAQSLPRPESSVASPAPAAPFEHAPVQQDSPQQETATASPKARRKMSLTPTEDEHDQIRQTFMATRHIHRFPSLNDFLRACVLQEITRLEDEYNDGHPFEYEGAEIPKGRPLKF